MKALRFDGALKLIHDAPVPAREGEALVRVIYAGICNTDLEIARGYAGFHGTLGHEFVGVVVDSADAGLIGRRVVGEINVGCDECNLCRSGDSRHCARRTVLGIKNRDGAFAEFLSLPARNLIQVPDSLPDEVAVFTEPLAAACQVLEQVQIGKSSRVAMVGDGKLAQLIAQVIIRAGCELLVIGKHEEKLELVRSIGARAVRIKGGGDLSNEIEGELHAARSGKEFDIVIETSGSESGLPLALALVKPAGTVVLKSTHHKPTSLDMSRIVVNEIIVVGSRCGRFQTAIDLLATGAIDVRELISERLPIEEGLAAFQMAAASTSLKVILDMA